MMNEYMYAIPVLDYFLVYTPANGFSALVNRKAFHEIRDHVIHDGNDSRCSNSELAGIAEALLQPDTFPAETRDEFLPKFLGIIPSRRCNMSCIYCDFYSDDRQVMDPRIAVEAVDYMAEQTERARLATYPIQFFGGEPFVEDEIIDIVVHHAYLVAGKTGIMPRIEACTNGLFPEKRTRFISDYFDRIILSIDGMREMHNTTRGNFDEVVKNARLLSSADVELSIRCCISQATVGKMEEIAEWLCRDIRPEFINFETLSENKATGVAGLYAPDPYEFSRRFVSASRIIEKYGITPVYAAFSEGKNRNPFCPLRKDSLIVFPDGKIAGCYLPPNQWEAAGFDLNIGMISPDSGVTIDTEAVRRVREQSAVNPRCRNCFCRISCGGGCAVSNRYTGETDAYNSYCIRTRLITVCRLLDEMDLSDISARLLENLGALEKTAQQISDRIGDIAV